VSVVIGAFFITILSNGMNLAQVGGYVQMLVMNAIVILAVTHCHPGPRRPSQSMSEIRRMGAMSLKGKVAIVTGAGPRASAKQLPIDMPRKVPRSLSSTIATTKLPPALSPRSLKPEGPPPRSGLMFAGERKRTPRRGSDQQVRAR
jgi:hypothetical protein